MNEELRKKMEEIEEILSKRSREKMKENKEEIKEAMEKLLENNRCMIMCTDIGIICTGTAPELMACLSMIINSLVKDNDITENHIKLAVQAGLNNMGEKEDKLSKLIDEILDKMGE